MSPNTEQPRSIRSTLSLGLDAPDWLARWGIILALFGVDTVWLAARHISAGLVSLNGAGWVVALLALAISLAMLSLMIRRLSRPLLAVSDLLESLVQLLVLGAFVVPFASLMASLDLPLIDDALMRADHALGFDWSTASAWVARYPVVDVAFRWAYTSIIWQAALALVIGSYARPGKRNAELIWLYLINVLTCIILSAVLPAIGEIGDVGMKGIDELLALRDGQWTLMSASSGGIVTFPSFHAGLAVIFTYSVRHYRWALVCLAPLNLVMLASTPTVGGHYLVDVIAGVAIAIGSIVLIRAVRHRYGNTPETFSSDRSPTA